jgi:hypothetical protein
MFCIHTGTVKHSTPQSAHPCCGIWQRTRPRWGDGAGSSGYLAAGCPTICSRVRLLKESRHTKVPHPVSGAPTSNDHLLYGLRKSGKTSQVLLPLQDIVYTTPVMDAAPASERSPPHIRKLHHIKDTGTARFATQELPSVIPLGWCRQ